MKLWRFVSGTYRSIRAKLLVCFLVVTVIPLLSLGSLSYYRSAQVINSQFGKYGDNAVAQLEQQTNAYLSRMNQTSESIFTYLLDPARVRLSGDVPSTYKEILDKDNLEDFLKALKTEHTAGIYIITPSGYYYGENNMDVGKLQAIPAWSRIQTEPGEKDWLGFYVPHHAMGDAAQTEAAEPVIGLAVPVTNPYGALRGSTILIEENAGELLGMFRLFEEDTNAHLRIVDAKGRVVYETKSSFAPSSSDIVWDKSLSANGWTIEARLTKAAFYRSSGLIRSYTLLVAGASCLLAFGFAYWFSSRFTRRIRRLKESMQKVSFGKLQTRTEVAANDELGVLDMSFNNMVRGIQTLVREVERTERKKKEAELRAFHYQITPHLLFNTLNSIQWKAKLQGAEEIRRMLYHLTMVLEGSLDISQELIPLGRELEIIGHYLKIQENRYGPVFEFELDCDPEAKKYSIPRMTLQPLFENIFFHGFEDGAGRISLAVREAGEWLELKLSDDGAGIPPDKLAKLRSPDGAAPKRKGRGGLGFRNADQRFKLHFGPQFGLSIDSAPGEGTTVTIVWPKKEETGHGDGNADQSVDR